MAVKVAGRGGVPASGVAAVAVTVAASGPAGTQLWLGAGAQRPRLPTLVGAGGPASAFAIVPVVGGKVRFWNGAKRTTKVTLQVTGWFSTRPPRKKSAGLFVGLAGLQAMSLPVKAGASPAVTLSGQAGLPKSGIGAVLVRVRTSGALDAGTIGLGGNGAAARKSAALAYGRGASIDLAVVTPGAGGRVTIRNGGRRAVTVALDVVGWFADGSDPKQTGDSLTLVRPRAVAEHAVDASGYVLATAGIGAVPTVSAPSPPSLVLARAVAGATAGAAGLSASAEGAPRSPVTAQLPARARIGRLLTLPPGAANRTVLSLSAGRGRVALEPFAYFSGATQLATGLHVTGAADRIRSVAPASVTFAGVPADLANLKTGDLVYHRGGRGAAAFLRRVVALRRTSGDLVVTTRDAKLAEAFRHAHIAFGGNAPGDAETASRSRQDRARAASASATRAKATRVAGASP